MIKEKIKIQKLFHIAGWIFLIWGCVVVIKGFLDAFFLEPEANRFSSEKWEFEEGCLSFPGEVQAVLRPAQVTVRARDRRGEVIEITGSELMATALQHEIDHLDGVLFIDHISRLRRSLVDRRMKKRARATGS